MICFSRLGYLGQLGNQLFQVAATLAAAQRFSTEALFPQWRYAQFFRQSFKQSLEPSNIAHTYFEPRAQFTTIPQSDNLDLFGFFQSHLYFRDSESLIRHSFGFVDNLLPPGWADKRADCAIHIRRGDYLNRSFEFVPLDIEYYRAAIAIMQHRGCKSFLVFSDDPSWAKSQLGNTGEFVEGLDEIQSLCLMSRCANFIIANSTFSWWGSWLCDNPKKHVIAPQTWYGFRKSLRKDESYQFCPTWQLLENRIDLGAQVLSLLRSADKGHYLRSYLNRKKWLEEEYAANIKRLAADPQLAAQ
ncbi:MAG TPA: alpha-1,2-fucosyltransferase [Planktothrix sp.]|jgi:hypothetical protein